MSQVPQNAARPGASREEQRPVPQRRRMQDAEVADQLWYDPARKPAHMSYNWKRVTYGGKEDTRHQLRMTQFGAWTPVPRKRHPELVGPNPTDPEGAIIVEGLMLMERPQEFTDEALQEITDEATGRVRAQFQSLGLTPQGTLPRTGAKVSRGYDRAVPEDIDEPK